MALVGGEAFRSEEAEVTAGTDRLGPCHGAVGALRLPCTLSAHSSSQPDPSRLGQERGQHVAGAWGQGTRPTGKHQQAWRPPSSVAAVRTKGPAVLALTWAPRE